MPLEGQVYQAGTDFLPFVMVWRGILFSRLPMCWGDKEGNM